MARRNFLKSSNPMMNEKAFKEASTEILDSDFVKNGVSAERMTVEGAINKSFILGGIMLFASLIGFAFANPIFLWGGGIAGLIIVIIASRNPQRSGTLAPIYAGFEGLFVGGITAMYASAFSGIIFQAVTLTMAMFFIMLFVYKVGIIKVTNKFRTGIIMATGAVLVVYVLSFVLSFFGINLPFLHEGGMLGIGISLVIIGIAALNLLLDFDNFEKGEAFGAPKYMEWFSAMGLLITLVWLYVEILRLLAMLSSSD